MKHPARALSLFLAAFCLLLFAACNSNPTGGTLVLSDFDLYLDGEADKTLERAGGTVILERVAEGEYETRRGIAVGSSVNDVVDAYGDVLCDVRFVENGGETINHGVQLAEFVPAGIAPGGFTVVYLLGEAGGKTYNYEELESFPDTEGAITFVLEFDVEDDAVQRIMLYQYRTL